MRVCCLGERMMEVLESARSLVKYPLDLGNNATRLIDLSAAHKLTRLSSFRSTHLSLSPAPSTTNVPVVDMKKSSVCISAVGMGARRLMVH
jgi:hypothetical protein